MMFGCGDSQHKTFNGGAKKVAHDLVGAGAYLVAEVGLGDDEDPNGYETKLKEWMASTLPQLLKQGAAPGKPAQASQQQTPQPRGKEP